jgi:transportin-3
MASKLVQDDKQRVYEAVAHVISAMPRAEAAETLKTFASVPLALVHTLATKPTATPQEIKEVCCGLIFSKRLSVLLTGVADGLENLESMLHVIRDFGDELPATCANSCQEAWAVFDPFLARYGSNYEVSEGSTRVFRHAIGLFGRSVLPIAHTVLVRLSSSFEATGFPGYLWISGKLVSAFGVDKDPTLHLAIVDVYERSTQKVIALIQERTAANIPDGEDISAIVYHRTDRTRSIGRLFANAQANR